jgi:hypothetical protein
MRACLISCFLVCLCFFVLGVFAQHEGITSYIPFILCLSIMILSFVAGYNYRQWKEQDKDYIVYKYSNIPDNEQARKAFEGVFKQMGSAMSAFDNTFAKMNKVFEEINKVKKG